MRLTNKLKLYIAGVSIAGAATVGAAAMSWIPRMLDGVAPAFWVFSAFLLLTEPVQIPRQNEDDESNISTTFAFALLMVFGWTAAVTVQTVATLIVDVAQRKPWWKICFNVGQLALTITAAALVFHWTPGLLPTGESMRFNVAELPAVVAAAVLFFVVNVTLNGVALAMTQSRPVARYLADDVASEAPAMGALLLMAPILVGMGEFGLFLTPLLAVPLLGVWMQGRLSVRTLHQALHDPVTGLPNRAFFVREVGATAKRNDGRLAIVLLGLGRFRDINETLGHESGERVLVEVARRLLHVCGEGHVLLAHLEGDEFGVMLRGSGSDAGAARTVAALALEALDKPLDLDGIPLYMGAAAGIAVCPDHGNAADVIRHADLALSLARESSSRCSIYDPASSKHTPMQLAMVGELRHALTSESDLLLHYQPKIDVLSGDVRDAEALVRWRHPTLGLVYPDAFVPLAERTGQITQLTSWVLNQAVRECARWRHSGLDTGVAVNISPRELADRSLVERVLAVLEAYGLPGAALSLEITEGAFLRDPDRAIALLDELRSHGIRVSLDDFGAGYSSLAYLKRLPLTEVKIDKSFVMNMATEPRDAMVVRSIVELGHNLGLVVVAEGVDDQETLDSLLAMGCDVAQGYSIARPMEATRLARWVAAAAHPRAEVMRLA